MGNPGSQSVLAARGIVLSLTRTILRLRLCGVMLIGACASSRPETPSEVTRAQIAALGAGDEAAARAWLAPAARVRAPLFPAPKDLPEADSVAEVERTALWQGGQRDLELVRGQSGWTIRKGVLALFSVDSAEGALAAFGRALEARDVGLVMALMPEESRRLHEAGRLEAQLAGREAAWRQLGQAIGAGRVSWSLRGETRAEAVVNVDKAPGGERRVVLVRERAGWKVFDVQPWTEYIAP